MRAVAGRRLLVAVSLLCLALLAAACVGPLADAGDQSTYNGTVTHVVDGDTLEVRLGGGATERVRLLGIDTPEVHVSTNPAEYPGVANTTAGRRCLRAAGENASAFLRERVAGERVRVETDPAADRRGDYDRLLAYVYQGEDNLNYALVAEGHARVYRTDFGQRDRFETAAASARAAGSGLWRCRTDGAP